MDATGRLGAKAVRLAEAGRHAEAVPLWERVKRIQPGNAAVALALGAALMGAGRFGDAADWLRASLERHPDHAGLAQLYGRVLFKQEKRPLALGAFFHALALSPDTPGLSADIANALYWERQSAAALPYAQNALEAEASMSNLSTFLCILVDLGFKTEALEVVDRALQADPANRAALLLFRSAALLALGRMREGVAVAREAARAMPDNKTAEHHYAAALLLAGELGPEAWGHYEARAALLERKHWPADHLRWTTQPIAGRTVVVHAEQGLGDTLQFVRYVPLLAQAGARVIVAVQPSLVRLLQGTPGAAQVISAGSLPPFDLYCPMLSLPRQFGTTLATIPPPLPYALPLPVAAASERLQVGLVWAGRDLFVDDRKRSLDPAALAPLAAVGDVEFHSLQFGAVTPPLPGMRDAMAGVTDFADTAARIAPLDLVIAVDTSVAHLAATMGKPVWLLARHNGCWRWLLDRTDSPWYPTVRLFRQGVDDDWGPVIATVADALAAAATAYRGNATRWAA